MNGSQLFSKSSYLIPYVGQNNNNFIKTLPSNDFFNKKIIDLILFLFLFF
jgi:hypothetical protein